MKTTSFEISKELMSIDFKAESSLCWSLQTRTEAAQIGFVGEDTIPAYDFETILQALPKKINDASLEIYFLRDCRAMVCYLTEEYCHAEFADKRDMAVAQQQNGSIADAASKMLILLHEKGLTNFNESNKINND